MPLLPAVSARSRKHRWVPRWPLARPLFWSGISVLAVCLLGFAVLQLPHRARIPATPSTANLQPGPLTAFPQDGNVAVHLDNAERLLTEIDHTSGPLDEATRERAAQLLLTNALFVQRAQQDGDTAQAAVLEQLGRTLTSVEHQPVNPRKSWSLRMEMNTSGLLLDIRILQQNDAEPALKERP